jgi:hypothetical protein
MPDFKEITPNISGSDPVGEQPEKPSSLPAWHKPQLSRISIAASSGPHPRAEAGTTDDFINVIS